MSARQQEQELEVGRRVAEEINRRRGSDYVARPAEEDPPDVELVSARGLPSIPIEVGSAPQASAGDGLMREDRDDLLRLEERLTAELRAAGLLDVQLNVNLQHGRAPSQVTRQHVESLVAFARESSPDGYSSMSDMGVWNHDESLSESVVHVSVLRGQGLDEPSANLLLAGFVPQDGRWIARAVEAKVRKYAPEVCRKLVLAIETLVFIDENQIASFSKEAAGGSCPFTAVWVVPRMGSARCVWGEGAGDSTRAHGSAG